MSADTAPMIPPTAIGVLPTARTCVLLFIAMAAAACTSTHQLAKEVGNSPPAVSYDFTSDEGLVEANAKARVYCHQYNSFPSMMGSITAGSDDAKRVTFMCVKVTPIVPSITSFTATPRGYAYHSDAELIQAVQSADAYCEQLGQTSWIRLTISPDGVNVLTFQCVPR